MGRAAKIIPMDRVRRGAEKAAGLAEAKLLSSGLEVADAKRLGMRYLTADEVADLHPSFKPLCALRLDYHDLRGEPLSDWPRGAPFFRLRYLEKGTSFDDLAEKKPPRYVQLPSTAPVAYFPRGLADWPALAADVDRPLIITEGEFKAAKACKEGFPTLGIGGVYNWKALKLGVSWLPSLDAITWLRRNVYLCFDSDLKSNEMVMAALHDIAEALHQRGAFAHVVVLPQLPGMEKVGLDDFLVHAGPTAKDQLRDLLTNAEPLGLTQPLFDFNERYLYVRDPGLVLNQRTLAKVSPSAFREHTESTAEYQERVLKPDGAVSYKPAAAAAAWLRWPLRREVNRLTYRPGKPAALDPDFNLWPGWGVEPKKGDVKPFLQLLKHLFEGAEPAALEWFLRWCAYPLQHPGVKLFSSAVIHGVRHGTGKSFVGYTLGRIYGKNFSEISEMDLHNHFNEWAEGKQFVLGDDVTGPNKRADADFLKKLITQRELRVNAKFLPTYVVPDCVNYLFTSQHADAFFLEDDDRRFFIHEVLVGPLSEEFYKSYEKWLDAGGSQAVFDYLLKLDLGKFNPAAPALRTKAKERMIDHGRSDLAGWVRQLLAAPEHVLKVGDIALPRDLFTSAELLAFYDPTRRTNTTANGLGRELARAGVRQVLGGQPVRLTDGSQGRYYIIRHPERWLATHDAAAIVRHLGGSPGARSSNTKKY